MLGDRAGSEAAVERQVARAQAQPVEQAGGGREQVGLVGGADRGGDGQDEAAGAAAGVLAQLGDLRDVAELGRLAQLALADRPGVGVGEGDEPVGDLLAGDALEDLAADLLGALGQFVESVGGGELGLRAAAASALAQPGSQATRLAHGLGGLLAGLAGQLDRGRLALPGAGAPASD